MHAVCNSYNLGKIIFLGEDPGTVSCGWTRGWVIKNQPEKMTKLHSTNKRWARLNADLI